MKPDRSAKNATGIRDHHRIDKNYENQTKNNLNFSN